MENTAHINPIWLPLMGGALTILFGIIAFFLSRLIKQIDKLGDKFEDLNNTMKRIDKDLSGDVGVLKSKNTELEIRLRELDPLWERMRLMNEDMIALKAGGCDIAKRGGCQ